MKINNEFTVSVPVEKAWEAMLDLESIAPCLPGAAITDQDSEDQYQGTMTVKIGPITAKYKGTVKYEEKDESAHRAVLHATGRDARGQGTASATITSEMEDLGESTKVNVETDMKLTGKAAQFGRGIAQDVAGKMLGQFAQCLEQRLGEDSGNGSSLEEGATEAAAGPTATATTSDNGTASAPSASAASASGGAPAGSASGSMAAPSTGSGSMAQPVMDSGSSSGTSSGSTGASSGSAGGASEEKPKSRKINQPDAEPLDLGEISQDAILKRVKPVLIGVGALLAVLLVIRGFRRRSN